jgi:hypothetical protein
VGGEVCVRRVGRGHGQGVLARCALFIDAAVAVCVAWALAEVNEGAGSSLEVGGCLGGWVLPGGGGGGGGGGGARPGARGAPK